MELRPPLDFTSFTPSERIIHRLAQQGVPVEEFDHTEPSLAVYAKSLGFPIPVLVDAILPTDLEMVKVHMDHRFILENTPVDPHSRAVLHESRVWLQWLMFEIEPWIALKDLSETSDGQHGVCGAIWGENDLAYHCRTCEHDPTCVVCVPCFQNGDHSGHDYSIIYTGSGCCDCGDETAWKREGFCSNHKGVEYIQPLSDKYSDSLGPVLDSLFIFWRKKLLSAENIYFNPLLSDIDSRWVADMLTLFIVEMLLEFYECSESLIGFVSKKISSTDGLLDLLVGAERFLAKNVVKKLHGLLLKSLGAPLFKYEFAKSFVNYYPWVVNKGVDVDNDIFRDHTLLSTFSVQIFTVPTLTPRLVKEMNLMEILFGCLGDIIFSCAGVDGKLMVTKLRFFEETIFRIVSDIRFVLSHDVVLNYLTNERHDILRTWMKYLSFLQGANPQKRGTGIFHEEESNVDMFMFRLGLCIGKIHEILVDRAFSVSNAAKVNNEIYFNTYTRDMDDEDNVRRSKVGRISHESSVGGFGSNVIASAIKGTEMNYDSVPFSLIPSPFIEIIRDCLRAIDDWIGVEMNLMNVLYPDNNISPCSGFLESMSTLHKIKNGRYIDRLADSGHVHGRNNFLHLNDSYKSVNAGNVQSERQSSKSVITKMVSRCQLSGKSVSNEEGGSSIEFPAFHVLSLSEWPEIIYDVSLQNVSIHIPLHRLLSALLRKSLENCYGQWTPLISGSANSACPLQWDFFKYVLSGCHPYGFSAFLMEHPLQNRVFCAQVHAGMWRSNGDIPLSSCGWYRGGLDVEHDLFLLQCCAALAPPDSYVNRVVRCFGLSSYVSRSLECSTGYEAVLVQEMLTLLIQIIVERRFCGFTVAESLKRDLVRRLAIGDATHSQLVKFLPRDLSKVDMLQDILDTVGQYSNPSGMNQGMYSLKNSYWKELDLYHPCWNSRDLQVAGERYLHFCGNSPLTTQLPKWNKIYDPLKGVAGVATCKMVFEIVRSVIYYSIIPNATSDAPDMVLLTALHLLSLALDIYFLQKHPNELSCYTGVATPLIVFAGEDTSEGMNRRSGDHSLLSLLVMLWRLRKNDDLGLYMEAEHFDFSFIESLLKKFGQIDSGCLAKLKLLAPEMVLQVAPSIPRGGECITGSASDVDRRKAKARERQAAIMEQMKSQQFKFLVSIDSTSDDVLNSSVSDREGQNTDGSHDQYECNQNLCSLCHDSSEGPLSYLVLLQKSRILSFVDRVPPSWEEVDQSDKAFFPIARNQIIDQPAMITFSGSSESFQTSHNAGNQFVSSSRFADIDTIRYRYPALDNFLDLYRSNNIESCAYFFKKLEEEMYYLICQQMHINQNIVEGGSTFYTKFMDSNGSGEDELIGKSNDPRSKTNSTNDSRNINRTKSEVNTTHSSACDGFGPLDADGIHLSSCGHALHQRCLDRYLYSLKERNSRRVSFEGRHIVDPDKGEFLCPVCRRLANSVLPALPGHSQKAWMQPDISSVSSQHLPPGNIFSLHLQKALSLLHISSYLVRKSDSHNALSFREIGRINPNLQPFLRVLDEMYFATEPYKQSVSGHPLVIWGCLKYSIISMEVAARSQRTRLAPTYDVNALYESLKSANGFILSLFIGNVQHIRCTNALHVIQRFRGLQLFEESICCDTFTSDFSISKRGVVGHLSNNSEIQEVSYNATQFWKRASDPVLAHDPFSSLMWLLFCLPYPFLLCKESFRCLVHLFYAVSVSQAIITYCSKYGLEIGFHDCLITDICKAMEEVGLGEQKYLVFNHIDSSGDILEIIRTRTFPYLRRCALLWHLVNASTSESILDSGLSSNPNGIPDSTECPAAEIVELEKLEKMFEIPPLDVTLKDDDIRHLSLKWLRHFHEDFNLLEPEFCLFLTPAIPFKLMHLPHVYQDLMERCIQHRACEPALCLLCGKLGSACMKPCCRENGCRNHAMSCGAGTGVFLLIKKTTILLQRSGRQALWPSLYLDEFGEEDFGMRRGKPLYLMEERYAALTQMVASHGLDGNSEVLHQTTIDSF